MELSISPGGHEDEILCNALRAENDADEKVNRVFKLIHAPVDVRTFSLWGFGPMNTIVRLTDNQTPELTIINFETGCYGGPVHDIRSWACDATILQANSEDGGLLCSFLSEYKKLAGRKIVTEPFVCKLAVRLGIVLLMLDTGLPMYCSAEDLEMWRRVAVAYIEGGVDENMVWLK